jgi:hypothetical protein
MRLTGLFQRDVTNRDATDNPLPLGAILGFAAGGGVLLFGALTFTLMYCARIKYRKQNGERMVLDADDEVTSGIRSTKPEMNIKNDASLSQSGSAKSSVSANWVDSDTRYAPPLVKPKAFQITGLRESWPLASLSTSPTQHQMTGSTLMATPGDDLAKGPVYTPSAANQWSQLPNLAVTKPVRGRPQSPLRGGQSFRISKSPTKRRYSRKSLSDNQLSSILRSTSQRLRDAQRRTKSSGSIFSQYSDLTPGDSPPSPPKTQESHEYLLSNRSGDNLSSDCVNSSVLDLFEATTPTNSPGRKARRSTGSGRMVGRSPLPSDFSDDDSVFQAQTPEIVSPASLTSPSKRNERSEISRRSCDSSLELESPISVKLRSESRTSIVAFGGRDIFVHQSTSLPESDPFISEDPEDSTQNFSAPKKSTALDIGQPPQAERKVVFGLELPVPFKSESGTPEEGGFPLRSVSGNINSPTRLSPFQYNHIPHLSLEIKTSPNPQRPVIFTSQAMHKANRARGHKRSKTVRLSSMQRPLSSYVVPEESELELSPTLNPDLPMLRFESPESTSSPGSPTSFYSKRTSATGSTRSPSIGGGTPHLSPFMQTAASEGDGSKETQPFMPSPNISANAHSYQISQPWASHAPHASHISRASHVSYSTMSFYEYYSSSTPGQKLVLQPSPPRSPEEQNKLRQAREFSSTMSSSGNPKFTESDIRNFDYPSPILPGLLPSTEKLSKSDDKFKDLQFQRRPVPLSFLPPSTESPRVSTQSILDRGRPKLAKRAVPRLHGPRSPPRPAHRDSLHASVAALRRMNSEVSTYSRAASVGDDDSPTMEALRGGGGRAREREGSEGRGGGRRYLAIDRNVRQSRDSNDTRVTSYSSTVRGRGRKERRDSIDLLGSKREKERGRERIRIAEERMSYNSSPTNGNGNSEHDELPRMDRDTYDQPSSPVNTLSSISSPITPSSVRDLAPTRTLSDRTKSIDSDEGFEIKSSGLKIQGLNFPVRNSEGSAIKESFQLPFALQSSATEKGSPEIKRPGIERPWSQIVAPPLMSMVRDEHESQLTMPQPVDKEVLKTPPRLEKNLSTIFDIYSDPSSMEKDKEEEQKILEGSLRRDKSRINDASRKTSAGASITPRPKERRRLESMGSPKAKVTSRRRAVTMAGSEKSTPVINRNSLGLFDPRGFLITTPSPSTGGNSAIKNGLGFSSPPVQMRYDKDGFLIPSPAAWGLAGGENVSSSGRRGVMENMI